MTSAVHEAPEGLHGLAVGRYVRVINYHNTPRARAGEYELQLAEAAERFAPIDEAGVEELLSGRRPPARPAVIPCLFEGYRNNYDVALELVERAGLTAWFFIPTAFIDCAVADQPAFAREHWIDLVDDEHGDGRQAMSWDELRDVVARGHVVASHTATHCTVAQIRTEEDVEREITAPRRRLAEELGVSVHSIAWLLGGSYGENPVADAAVRAAGYRLHFGGGRIQRIPGP